MTKDLPWTSLRKDLNLNEVWDPQAAMEAIFGKDNILYSATWSKGSEWAVFVTNGSLIGLLEDNEYCCEDQVLDCVADSDGSLQAYAAGILSDLTIFATWDEAHDHIARQRDRDGIYVGHVIDTSPDGAYAARTRLMDYARLNLPLDVAVAVSVLRNDGMSLERAVEAAGLVSR